jgi:hypothetical protein
MNKIFNTGNSTVDALGEMNFKGNITPLNWYKTILRDNGKPYLLAIVILSEICYWYRPMEIRDEQSGMVIGYKKRFKEDLLQKNYQQFCEMFGESKRAIKSAMEKLEEMGLIKRELRNIKFENGMIMNNVQYIHLNEKRLYEVTFCKEEDSSENENVHMMVQNNVCPPAKVNDNIPQNEVVADDEDDDMLLQLLSGPITVSSETNTENTTEITNENTSENTYVNNSVYTSKYDSSHQSYPIGKERSEKNGNDLMDRMEAARRLIKDNIEYEYLSQDRRFEKELLDELIEIMAEICVVKGDINICGRLIPHELIKSRFEKYDMMIMEYVLCSLKNNTSEVRNIRKYLIATLYNAPLTMKNQVTLEVQHDLNRF